MLNCNYPNCKKHKTCNLKEPTNPLTTETRFWLKKLRQAEKRIHEYSNVMKDINIHHKYSIPVNVYGHIMYAPKVNTFGVFIRRPEHVYYGWNLNKLEKRVEELTEKVRNLRLKELEMMR